MAYHFSATTAALLKQAGWDEHRRIDPFAYATALASKDLPVNDKAMEFWTSFGGLRVVHPHARVPGEMDFFELDPVEAAKRLHPKNLQRFSRDARQPLCIIGDAFRRYMTLMMDPQGVVYAGLDRLLEVVGSTGETAIEALCSGKPLEPLPRARP